MKKILKRLAIIVLATLGLSTAVQAKDVKIDYTSSSCEITVQYVKVVGSPKEWSIHIAKNNQNHKSAPGCKVEYKKTNNFLNIMGIMYYNDPDMVQAVLVKLRKRGIIGDFDLDPQTEKSLLYKAIVEMGKKYYPSQAIQ